MARIFGQYQAGDLFVHHEDVFVLLESESSVDHFDVVGLYNQHEPDKVGFRRPNWLRKNNRIPYGYDVYRAGVRID